MIASVTFGIGMAIILMRNGLLSGVQITEEELPAMTLVGKPITGDYKQSAIEIEAVQSTLLASDITPQHGFGIYYDNPRTTPKNELRSIVGHRLTKSATLPTPLRAYSLPKTQCIVAEFPYKSPLSIALGVVKVYPKLFAALKEKGHEPMPIIELYEADQGRIRYVAAVGLKPQVFEGFLKA